LRAQVSALPDFVAGWTNRTPVVRAEMPFFWKMRDDRCLEGVIDLALFDPATSEWLIIDWKTNRISRDKIDVLLRLDVKPGDTRAHADGDYPLAWAKMYGKGRVFFGSFAHASATWDIRDVQQMYFEAMRWALGLTDADVVPHAMRGSADAAAGRGRGGSR
jgi:hypothetical protein